MPVLSYSRQASRSSEAENVANLPGGPAYYTNQAKGKSEAWIKQFLESEWGFSISGKPVVPTFKLRPASVQETTLYSTSTCLLWEHLTPG
jgi:hypothetical protein